MASRRARIIARQILAAAARITEPPRIFVAAPGEIRCVQASPGVSRAYDIMAADGVPPQKAADMAAAAERSGRDPVAFAEHFVKVRKSLRDQPV